MPYDVKEERRADSLTRGTRVVLPETPDEVLYVQSATRKIKYVYLTLGPTPDGDATERLQYELNATLTTIVEKLTDSEQLAHDYQRAQRWAQEQLAAGLAQVPAEKLKHIADEWLRGTYRGHVLDWSDGTSFLKLQAMYKVWHTIEVTVRRLSKLYGYTEITALSAVVLELHHHEEERRNYSPNDPTSRSSNVLSNLIDELDRWAWEKLADDARWQLSDDVVKHETDRLRELAAARKAAQSFTATS